MKKSFKQVLSFLLAAVLTIMLVSSVLATHQSVGMGTGSIMDDIVLSKVTITFADGEDYDLTANGGTEKKLDGSVVVTTATGKIAAPQVPGVTTASDKEHTGWAVVGKTGEFEEISITEYLFTKSTTVYPVLKTVIVDDEYIFPFVDVKTSDWFYSDVYNANKMGLINGKTTTRYYPNDNMTYAEAIKIAACMNQYYIEGEVTLENGSDKWYDSYYEYCLENGIIKSTGELDEPGYDELYQKANDPISREIYVYIFAHSLPEEALEPINSVADDAIPDVKSSSESVLDDAIYMMYRAGILNGNDAKGTFRPDSNIKRSEVAAIISRMMHPEMRKSIAL